MQLTTAIDGCLIAFLAENKSPKTLKTAQWHLGKFVSFSGDITLEQTDRTNIRNFLIHQQSRGLSPHSVHSNYKVLKIFSTGVNVNRWFIRTHLRM